MYWKLLIKKQDVRKSLLKVQRFVGGYEVEIDLHKEVKKDVKFSVVAE